MQPAKFPEAAVKFTPPNDLEESQCRTIPAYRGRVEGGSCDGYETVVVAYDLSPEEIEILRQNGGRIFLSMLGGLAPHFLSFSFHEATHPA